MYTYLSWWQVIVELVNSRWKYISDIIKTSTPSLSLRTFICWGLIFQLLLTSLTTTHCNIGHSNEPIPDTYHNLFCLSVHPLLEVTGIRFDPDPMVGVKSQLNKLRNEAGMAVPKSSQTRIAGMITYK